VVANLIQLFGLLDAKRALEGGKLSAFVKAKPTDVAAEPLQALSRAPRRPAKKPRVGVKVE